MRQAGISNHRTLLREYDTEGTFGSGKWANGVKEDREKVLDAIYGPFRLRCARKDGVTKDQASSYFVMRYMYRVLHLVVSKVLFKVFLRILPAGRQ